MSWPPKCKKCDAKTRQTCSWCGIEIPNLCEEHKKLEEIEKLVYCTCFTGGMYPIKTAPTKPKQSCIIQ